MARTEIPVSVSINKELLEWFDMTFPGLNRSWFVNKCLSTFKKRFNQEYYPPVVEKIGDEIYDGLKRDE